MANKQVRHWYDKVAKTEKLNKLAWMAQRNTRKLEKWSREGYQLTKVTNDLYSFSEAEPEERKYFLRTINGYSKGKNMTDEWFREMEPYTKRVIAREGWRLVLELDPEKLDDEYYFIQMRKMKKAMTLPAFFGIYGLIWLCLALTMDYIPLVMFLIWAMIAAALGYSIYTLLTCLAEIRRIKRDWVDTF